MEINPNRDPIYDKALALLSIRAHSTSELRQKLLRKGFPPDDVSLAIDRLIDEKFLNDTKAAEGFVRSLLSYKTYGYFGILMKLKEKGISQSLAEQILSENLSLEQEQALAEKLIRKNRLSGKKLVGTLQRKGFRSQIISKYLDQLYSSE